MQDGKSAFALQTRPPLPSDSGLTYSKLFLDGLCVAVNPANPVNNLTIAQVRDVFLAQRDRVGRRPRLEPALADLGVRAQLDRRSLHVLPERGARRR